MRKRTLADFYTLWVYGGITGTTQDLTIALSRFIHQLLPNERVFADKGYRGCPIFLTPIAGKWETLSQAQQTWNFIHTHLHWAHIERVNKRLKHWKCLKTPWRHDISHHHFAFYVIAKITNIALLVEPLNAE